MAGKREMLALADPSRKDEKFVSIGGGTFSDNPLTMAAGLATIRHLRKNARTIYPRLRRMGEEARTRIDRAFEEARIEAHTTGAGSLFLTHFGDEPKNAEEAAKGDSQMRAAYALHLIAWGIFFLPGHPGGISTSHTSRDIGELVARSRRAAVSLKRK